MKIIVFLIIFLLVPKISMADIVHLRDGTTFEAITKILGDGTYLIDGIVFTENEVSKIVGCPLSENSISKKKIWWEKILYWIGLRTNYEKRKEADLEAYKERMKNNDEARPLLTKDIYAQKKKEIQKAKWITERAKSMAQQAEIRRQAQQRRNRYMKSTNKLGEKVKGRKDVKFKSR